MPDIVLGSGNTLIFKIEKIPTCDANIQMRSSRKLTGTAANKVITDCDKCYKRNKQGSALGQGSSFTWGGPQNANYAN